MGMPGCGWNCPTEAVLSQANAKSKVLTTSVPPSGSASGELLPPPSLQSSKSGASGAGAPEPSPPQPQGAAFAELTLELEEWSLSGVADSLLSRGVVCEAFVCPHGQAAACSNTVTLRSTDKLDAALSWRSPDGSAPRVYLTARSPPGVALTVTPLVDVKVRRGTLRLTRGVVGCGVAWCGMMYVIGSYLLSR